VPARAAAPEEAAKEEAVAQEAALGDDGWGAFDEDMGAAFDEAVPETKEQEGAAPKAPPAAAAMWVLGGGGFWVAGL
jgi:hypothetical protein